MSPRHTPEHLARVVEFVRKAHSSDSAYQHLLDTIADDVNKKFGAGLYFESGHTLDLVNDIVKYIKTWDPARET